MGDASTSAEPWPGLIASLTHELRHEVSAVLHQVELLCGSVLDEPTQRRSLAAIESNADNLMGFIEDLSELGRIVGGEITPTCRWIEIDELIGASVRDRSRPLDWTAPLAGDTEAWSTYTDPLIVDQIVTGILDQYHRDRLDADVVVSAFARRGADQFIEVVFTSKRGPFEPEPFRTATLDDGLSMFVAGKSAELVGGEFGVAGPSHAETYLLRLPHSDSGIAPSSMTD